MAEKGVMGNVTNESLSYLELEGEEHRGMEKRVETHGGGICTFSDEVW